MWRHPGLTSRKDECAPAAGLCGGKNQRTAPKTKPERRVQEGDRSIAIAALALGTKVRGSPHPEQRAQQDERYVQLLVPKYFHWYNATKTVERGLDFNPTAWGDPMGSSFIPFKMEPLVSP